MKCGEKYHKSPFLFFSFLLYNIHYVDEVLPRHLQCSFICWSHIFALPQKTHFFSLQILTPPSPHLYPSKQKKERRYEIENKLMWLVCVLVSQYIMSICECVRFIIILFTLYENEVKEKFMFLWFWVFVCVWTKRKWRKICGWGCEEARNEKNDLLKGIEQSDAWCDLIKIL